MEATEGVTKFEAEHESVALEPRRYRGLAAELFAWRQMMAMTGLVGRDPARYDGAAYGNLSGRVGAPSSPRGARAMLISGTQTGNKSDVELDDFCVVSRYDITGNRVESRGLCRPSSESMTHGAVYDCSPTIRFVFHGHCPAIWQAQHLKLPRTPDSIAYGTVAMANAVTRLYRETNLAERRVFLMGGHLDGIVTFGRNADEAGVILLTTLASALRTQR